MNTVNVTLFIELMNNEENLNPFFNEGWNFSLDRYTFKKVSATAVEVSFSFNANLTDKDKLGVLINELPSLETKEFQKYEEELCTILDLLSLTISRGIRIKSSGYLFDSPYIGGSFRASNKTPVSLNDTLALQKQYETLNKEDNKRLIFGLRSYRLFLCYEDVGDKIAKLWSIIERILGREGGSILSKDRLATLTKIFSTWTELSPEEKGRLSDRLKETYKKSLLDSLVEGLDLMTSEGIISVEERKKRVKVWRTMRNYPIHGKILPKRDERVRDTLSDMESTVETILYSRLTPKMIFYVVFNKNHVDKDFRKRQGKLLSKLKNDICALAFECIEFEFFKKSLSSKLIKDDVAMYFVTYNKVFEVKKDSFREANLLGLDKYLMKVIGVLQVKISNIK